MAAVVGPAPAYNNAMRVLVTGGTGVVGTRTVDRLIANGHTIRLVSRNANEDARQWKTNVEPWPGNVADATGLKGAADDCDLVLHIAGIVALVFDYRRNKQKKHLGAADLRAALAPQVGGPPLVPSRHAAAEGGKVQQSDVWADLVGDGKISCEKTLDNL